MATKKKTRETITSPIVPIYYSWLTKPETFKPKRGKPKVEYKVTARIAKDSDFAKQIVSEVKRAAVKEDLKVSDLTTLPWREVKDDTSMIDVMFRMKASYERDGEVHEIKPTIFDSKGVPITQHFSPSLRL